MATPGTYKTRLDWLQVNRTEDPITGEWPKTYSPSGRLWASVEEQSGTRREFKGAEQTGAAAEIRIQNYPAVSALDLLRDRYTGYVWHIDSIFNGDGEIVLDCYRLDELIDYEIEDDSDSH